tara:strand:+ start:257 stop:481 length:225 start_codon:yes stop_codon:yes gene_type:complete
MKKMVNGELVDLTAEEISQREIENANEETKQIAEDNKIEAKAAAKASGNTKLLDLGLSQAEATALTGYAPPSEV